jgi:CSLREA domain-containing protein
MFDPRKLAILAAAFVTAFLMAASIASAETYTVNSTADPGSGGCDATECTLREAVEAANAHGNLPAIAPEPDVVTFATSVTGAIQLADDPISITSDSLHIVGPGADKLTVFADPNATSGRVFELFGFGAVPQDDYDVTISALTLDGGHVIEQHGGVILTTDGGFDDYADDGEGRFFCGDLAALTVNGVHITDGHADASGGGIAAVGFRCSEKAASPGTADGDVNVLNSTISANHAGGAGGGISMRPGSGSLFVSNSTIANNTSDAFGGGISVVIAFGKAVTDEGPAPTFAAQNATISGNDVGADDTNPGGGIFSGPAFALRSSIVYGNTVTPPEEQPVDSKAGSTPSDLGGNSANSFSAGYSLIGTVDSGTTLNATTGEPNLSTDPQLGPLQNNGGPTPTELPATTSPAIDTGIGNGLTTDQRGLPRTVDRVPANAADGTDIGAVEIPADPEVVVPPDQPAPVEPTPIPAPATQLCLGKQVILTKGSDADEKLTGTGVDDGILGGGGQDQIDGLSGDDCLFGQPGDDNVVGGPGDDNANGDTDDDTVKGDDGADSVRGQNGNDRVFGGSGDDPKVTGGAGDDVVKGGDGNDFVKGDGGNDSIIPGGGEDFVHAGGGADTINAADGDKDQIICGTGKDVANVDAIDDVDKDCNTVNVIGGPHQLLKSW